MKSQVRNLSFLLLLVSVAPKFSSAQVASYPPVTIPGSEVRTIKSTSTGRTYDLYIHKPADFDKNKDKKYPVLYLLDGQWDFKLLDSVVGGLVYDKWMPEIVFVGITYSGDHPDYDALRAMDYTPTPGNPKGSGDGPKFLNFLKTELIPLWKQTSAAIRRDAFSADTLLADSLRFTRCFPIPHCFGDILRAVLPFRGTTTS